MLISVQYARAAAALLVVVGHMAGFSAFHPISDGHFGGFGVDIFFVISGFIMWETSKEQRPSEFVQRRLSRIVPPYWFYTTLLVALAFAAPALTPNVELGAKALFGSYFFIPYTDQRGLMNPILLQGWTLNLEMYFYVIFALGLFIANHAWRFFAVSAYFLLVILLGLVMSGSDASSAVVTRFTSPILIEFILGMLVSIAWTRWKIGFRPGLALFLAAAAALIYADSRHLSGEINFITYGIPAAFLLLGLLGMEDVLARHPLRPLVAAGNASYSLYLAHPFVLSAVHVVFQRWARSHPETEGIVFALAFALTATVVALLFSYASYALIEKPAGKFLMAKLSGKSKHAPKGKTATV